MLAFSNAPLSLPPIFTNGLDDTKPAFVFNDKFWLVQSYVDPKPSLVRAAEESSAWLSAAGPFSEKYPLAVCSESGLVGVGGNSNGVCSISSDGLYGVTICCGGLY